MIDLIKAGVFDSTQVFETYGRTPLRVSDCYEVELYISGEGESVVDGVSFPHQRGNLLFARPGQKRYSENRFLCFYLHVNMDEMTNRALKEFSTFMKVTDFNLYKKCYIDIIKLYESGTENHWMKIQCKLYELFDMILGDSKLKKSNAKISPEAIQNAIDFMEQNFAKHLVLKDIAEYVNFSPIYFHKEFTLCTGKTPHAFLCEKRMEAAKSYLLTTDRSINEIVEKCGFSSVSYFDYSFKKEFGVTPLEFRKRKYIL